MAKLKPLMVREETHQRIKQLAALKKISMVEFVDKLSKGALRGFSSDVLQVD